ncbi:polysaccharide deacetylase family protein [Herbiconiux sp. CPCC 205716]|uniref:Polysaccharide deacetylase family protein n=1 Tax=Herbiconiux gentiana TaxID=2970912 RepID=A0ABT2GCN9_9MICO|nr:polysaccharide deacetylase family protein [Herbiconiux gentiana]MCS5713918.1 polysaccharide deacetylase family protein [Herbiconiux gentiana]
MAGRHGQWRGGAPAPRHALGRPPHRAPTATTGAIDRRVFLGVLGVGAVAGVSGIVALTGAAQPPLAAGAGSTGAATRTPGTPPTSTPAPTATAQPVAAEPEPTPTPTPTPEPVAEPAIQKLPLPSGAITGLPGDGALLAWTVDDGSNADVIRLYTEFAAATGTRLTFFLNGCYDGWTANADLLRPLVASGQVQLGNHTFDHVDLTSLSDSQVVAQLQKNHDFILSTYGVDARPYYRPPYGYRDARTDALAASIGYTCPVLWYGSLSDSGLITEQQVVDFATQWFLPQHIVIGHLNYLPVTNVFPQLTALVAERGLRTVTLDDVFLKA